MVERQSATRVPELVPIRYGRMLESPFRFYRGAAAIMAADLEDPKVANLIATELSTLTGGNEFKPDFLQREKGKFTFERAGQEAAAAR